MDSQEQVEKDESSVNDYIKVQVNPEETTGQFYIYLCLFYFILVILVLVPLSNGISNFLGYSMLESPL